MLSYQTTIATARPPMSMRPPRRPGVACSGKRRVSGLQQYLWVQDETMVYHLAQ